MPTLPCRPAGRSARTTSPLSAAVLAATTALGLVAGAASPADAQSAAYVTACQTALVQDRLVSTTSERQAYAWFSTISEQNFKERQRAANASTSAKIPIAEELMGKLTSAASYSGFDQTRRDFFQANGYQSNRARESYDLQLTTSPAAYRAYEACVKAHSTDNQAPAAWIREENATTVWVEVRNFTPDAITLDGDLENASSNHPTASKDKPFRDGLPLKPGAALNLKLTRRDTLPITLTVSPKDRSALIVPSKWSRQPPGQLEGVVTYQKADPMPVARGVRSSPVWITQDIWGVPCQRGGMMSMSLSDGSLRMICYDGLSTGIERTLWVEADSGARLGLPRVMCEGGDPSCAISARTVECNLLSGERRGYCTVRVTGHPRRITVVADRFELVARAKPDTQPLLGFHGTTIRVALPANVTANSATLSYRAGDDDRVMRVGDASSPDGRIREAQPPLTTPTETIYIYAVDLTPARQRTPAAGAAGTKSGDAP